MTIDEFIDHVNKKRKLNKNNWVFFTGIVEGIKVEYKAYNTWIQVLRMGFIRGGNNMNSTVKAYKYFLKSSLESELVQIEKNRKYNKIVLDTLQ